MRLYRIKQIGEDKFIPQTANLFDYIIGDWMGIDIDGDDTWYNKVYQEMHCICGTLEEAREVIKKYKEHIKPQKVKYHKP